MIIFLENEKKKLAENENEKKKTWGEQELGLFSLNFFFEKCAQNGLKLGEQTTGSFIPEGQC